MGKKKSKNGKEDFVEGRSQQTGESERPEWKRKKREQEEQSAMASFFIHFILPLSPCASLALIHYFFRE